MILAIYQPDQRHQGRRRASTKSSSASLRDGVTAAELDRAKTGYLQQQQQPACE